MAIIVIASVIFWFFYGIPTMKYNDASDLMEQEKYTEAIELFADLDGYRDSEIKIDECNYKIGKTLMYSYKYDDAIKAFEKSNNYKNAKDMIEICKEAIFGEK